MMRGNDKKTILILSVTGIVPVVWIALCVAPYAKGGLVEMLSSISKAFENPFQVM